MEYKKKKKRRENKENEKNIPYNNIKTKNGEIRCEFFCVFEKNNKDSKTITARLYIIFFDIIQ